MHVSIEKAVEGFCVNVYQTSTSDAPSSFGSDVKHIFTNVTDLLAFLSKTLSMTDETTPIVEPAVPVETPVETPAEPAVETPATPTE